VFISFLFFFLISFFVFFCINSSKTLAVSDNNIPGVALPSSPFNGSLDEWADTDDVFHNIFNKGDHLSITLTGDANTDFDLYLFPPGSTDVWTDMPVAEASGDTYPETLLYTIPTSGEYYLDIFAYSGSGNYTITYTVNPSSEDDNIPGVPITTSPVTGSLDYVLDVDDVYRIELNPGQKITASIITDRGNEFYLYLFSPGSTDVQEDFPLTGTEGIDYPESFTYVVPSDGGGTYYLDAYAASGKGSYTISYAITTASPDDNIPGVPIPVSPISEYLNENTDLDDVFRIDLNSGERFVATLIAHSGTDFDLYLFPPGSRDIWTDEPVAWAESDKYPDKLSYIVPQGKSGTYYLDVYGFSGEGNYNIFYSTETVSFVPKNDFNRDFLSDVGLFYRYGTNRTGLWGFYSNGISFHPEKEWGSNAWSWEKSKVTGGNFRSLVLAREYSLPGTTNKVFIQGNYAYIANESSGLQIVDISDPYNPQLIGSYDTSGQAGGVYVSGDYAYISDGNSGDLLIFDVSDPTSPFLKGVFDTASPCQGIFVSGSYAYFCSGSTLFIVDVSNPSDPHAVASVIFFDPHDVFVRGNYAYVSDMHEGLYIVDVSDPTSPKVLGNCRNFVDHRVGGVPWNLYVAGNYAYIADSKLGLQIVDVSNPSSPLLVASCNTPGNAKDVYVDNGVAYVADFDGGLQIIDVTNPLSPSIVSSYRKNVKAKGVFYHENYVYVCYMYRDLLVFDAGEKPGIAVLYKYSSLRVGLWAFISDGTRFSLKKLWGSSAWSWDRSKLVSGDFNGDEKTDLAILYKYGTNKTGLWLFISKGMGFSVRKVWHSNAWSWDRSKLVSGDFNGDEKTDLAILYKYGTTKTGLWLFTSKGNSFSVRKVWHSNAFSWDRSKITSGNFNGDEKTDLAILYKYGTTKAGLWVFTSKGTNFTLRRAWLSSAWSWDRSKLVSGDFNGDGRTDIAVLYKYGETKTALWLFTSNETSFSVRRAWSSSAWSWNKSKLVD